MILIADSGSTKTDWCILAPQKTPQRITTKGLNPFFQTSKEIEQEINQTLIPHLPAEKLDSIYFYGAGCIPEKAPILRQALQTQLSVQNEIKVYTDMLGAARGLCGHQPGIACILGTGSNSCFYDGQNITANVSPLGFILGDEGSGAYLGKQFIGDLLKNQLTPQLKEEFLTEYQLTPSEIIDRVYRKPFPNRFLASFSPFIANHIDHPNLHQLVLMAFKSFIQRNVKQYDYTQYPVHFIGSIALHYHEILIEAAQLCDLQLGKIQKSPMDGLISYHQKNQENKR